jgi:pyruvate dehydrogenase E2 component (dihydrolipoamide acetyltransferase)
MSKDPGMKKLRAFTMPKWGIEMTEGTIADWAVAEGAAFSKGDVIALIETDKITNEYEAEFDGQLASIVVSQGETVAVGTLLGVFAREPADKAEIEAFLAEMGHAPAPTAQAPEPTSQPAPSPAAQQLTDDAISAAARQRASKAGVDVGTVQGTGRNGRITLQDVDQAVAGPAPARDTQPVSIAPQTTHLEDVFASPLAKRLSVQHGVDLRDLSGSGPRGRICKADVLEHVPDAPVAEVSAPAATAQSAAPESAAPPPPPAGDDRTIVAMSPMRKAIARQLTLSKSTIPHFYLRSEAHVDALLAMREMAKRATGSAPSINDYLVRAAALALQKHPDVNVQVHGDAIHQIHHSDIAIAVASDKGLITPIVPAAETKSVAQLSSEIKALAGRARDGKLRPEEFQGGSFTISNLGMFGITQFDAIINPPQGAILAVGAVREHTSHENFALVYAKQLHLSLSCDHRAIDGAVGARFLAELVRLIESPEELTA